MSLFSRKKIEEAPDTLTHLYLNPENSSWANLGYWKDTDDYPAACKTLAVLLGRKAELGPGLKVLDLGFGCGDQFFVWKEEFSVAFGDLTGVNASSVQTEFAKNLLDCRGFSPSDSRPTLILSPIETALPSFADQSFDRILCLDSAAFFSDRTEFCKEAFRILKPGGRLVSAELILNESPLHLLDSWFRSAVCALSSIPKGNRVTTDSLSQILRGAGFTLEDGFAFLEKDVFEGFSRFLKRATAKPRTAIPERIANNYARFADFLGSERMRRYFRFVLYSAQKPF
ncbi:SAM-dependent methyltransferase [Leptospira yasudae]|uniref:class I SAM-dependent methyltransferase n=1 Tax=Leptospira yasudae TaxID=2202201 RepID=UPI000E59BCBF|nr:class I SAM-dependent methyltransferase [Leptospira yasudae]RHX95351.1 SAM-dependent methyltransferase [Leptospira yasudae]